MGNGTKWASFLGLILIFAAGVFSGILIERKLIFPAYNPRTPAQQPRQQGQQSPPHHNRGQAQLVDRLDSRLGLSGEQTAQLESILEEHSEVFMEIHAETREKFNDLDFQLYHKIESILDDSQKKQLLMIWNSPFMNEPPQPPRGQGGGDQPPPDGPGAGHHPPPHGGPPPHGRGGQHPPPPPGGHGGQPHHPPAQ